MLSKKNKPQKAVYKLLLASTVLIVSFLFTGCFNVSDSFLAVKGAVFKNANIKCRQQTEFAIGKVSLCFTKILVRFIDIEEAESMLRYIDGVEIGNYELDKNPEADMQKITECIESRGWNYFIKNKERNECSILLAHYDTEASINGLLIIDYSNNHLSIVKVHGRLGQIAKMAIKEKNTHVFNNMQNRH